MSEQYRQLPIENLSPLKEPEYVQSSFLRQEVQPTEEEITKSLESEGLIFQRIPEDWYPGKPFTTPRELAESDVTAYTQKSILYLMKRNNIGGIELAGNKVLEVDDVIKIKELENAPAVDGTNRGRPAGWKVGVPVRRDALRNSQ